MFSYFFVFLHIYIIYIFLSSFNELFVVVKMEKKKKNEKKQHRM